MPPSSTDVTDNNNKTSSVLFKLDLDQFTTSTSNNASNNSTISSLNLSTSPSSVPCKKRKFTVTSTWALSCEPLPYKAICNGKNKI